MSIEGEPIKPDTIEKGAKLEEAINHCKTIQEEYLLVHMKNIFILYKLDKIHEFMNNINSQIQNINIDDNCIEKIKDKLNSRQNLIENFSDLSKIVNKIQNTKETQNLKGLTNENTNGELVTLTGGANQPGSLTSFIKDLKLKITEAIKTVREQLIPYDNIIKNFNKDGTYSDIEEVLEKDDFNEDEILKVIRTLFERKNKNSYDKIESVLTRCYALGELYFVKHDLFIVIAKQYKLFLKAAIYIFRIAVLMLEISEKFQCQEINAIQSIIQKFEMDIAKSLPGVDKLSIQQGGAGENIITQFYKQIKRVMDITKNNTDYDSSENKYRS